MKRFLDTALESMMVVGVLALPLSGCEVNTTRQVETTGQGVQVEKKTTEIGLDRDVADRAREVGRDVEEAGRDLGREAKEGVDEVRSRIPDVDVDVKVKDRNDEPGR
jgi:hypothetical protein